MSGSRLASPPPLRALAVHEFVALSKGRAFPSGLNSTLWGSLTGKSSSGTGTAPPNGAVYHGDRRAPISLAGYEPVAKAVVGLESARVFAA